MKKIHRVIQLIISLNYMSFTMWEESKEQWGKLAVSEFKSASY